MNCSFHAEKKSIHASEIFFVDKFGIVPIEIIISK